MGVVYDYLESTEAVHELIAQVIEEEFPVIFGLTTPLVVRVSFLHDDEGKTSPLKQNGFPVDAILSIVAQKDRGLLGPDVLLRLDRDTWNALDGKSQKALLSSHLRFLEFKGALRDENGAWQPLLDSLGRPKVKKRAPDFRLAGFFETIQVHGEVSPEKSAINAINEKLRQTEFTFSESKRKTA